MENVSFTQLISFFSSIKPILQALDTKNARVYVVGGCVRDLVLNRPLKDFDLEVHGISAEELEAVLKNFGPTILIGKQFGVFKVDGVNADWALPRTDSSGRKPTVEINPKLTIEQAARRRDINMNSMSLLLNDFLDRLPTNPGQLVIIDPYNGLQAIKNNVISAVDKDFFIQDPLRFYRVMQFAARFDMVPDQELSDLCKKMDLHDPVTHEPIARERIFDEIKKMLLLSNRPSLGFRWIDSIGRLEECFPELAQTKDVFQRPDMHPEKDVFEHTMQALDAAAEFDYQNDTEKLTILLTMICHDLGKITTTTPDGKAHGHDVAGVEITQKFLKRYTDQIDLLKTVGLLVRHHLAPGQLTSQNSSLAAYKRLAKKLWPHATLHHLSLVGLADNRGRNGTGPFPLCGEREIFNAFTERCSQAGVLHGPEEAVLQGRDLIGFIEQGPALGKALEKAYSIQIEENIKDADELKKRLGLL